MTSISYTFSYFFLILLLGVPAQEVTTPASLLGPRNYNHHAYDTRQYLQRFNAPETTKHGPVLFPNDAPPPPRPPLIVTSRPLIESIARSELNPTPATNNSIAEPSQIDRVSFKPDFLTRVKNYQTYSFDSPSIADPLVYDDQPYNVLEKVNRNGFGSNHVYDDYEESSVLPPIYNVLSDYAKQNVLKKSNKDPNRYKYKVKSADKSREYNSDTNYDDNSSDNDQAQNYAFSYAVKDKKTGDDFSHSQQSSGSATNGEYRVRLPDGRMQIVSYTADENGYQANVRYDEEEKDTINTIETPRNIHNKNEDHYNGNNNAYYSSNDQNNYVRKQQENPRSYDLPKTNDYYNTDTSREYYSDDYSLEYDGKDDKYEPHRSKFSSFVDKHDANENLGVIVVPNQNKNIYTASTVKPSFEELKYLFIPKKDYSSQLPGGSNYVTNKISEAMNVPSTTVTPILFDPTTERVVLIGGRKSNLYTNIRHSIPPVSVTPTPITYSVPNNFIASTTPSNYLLSTISSLRKNVDMSGPKPVLSSSFIDRINKYLTLK